ncbi:hypothetical protein SD427_18070 [Chryseobacterium sp. JJR-5R]|uniref:hypothetical protein n=1 Tax=Chryseobacterium sp. JJR-5R TaxID=3093923 RepID=UPI002A757F9A|nr:hypothetical protein [Chryseobacterium sp. JJR-5R]WPO82646.1 hypothetical protein SD427_18070 [Chryseobacterium sp. JJR-5R]
MEIDQEQGQKQEQEQEQLTSISLSSDNFAANESLVIAISIKPSAFKKLLLKNNSGQRAEFLWQKNTVSDDPDKGYFKETLNDLGVKINHTGDSVVIINGGAAQYLKAELKV